MLVTLKQLLAHAGEHRYAVMAPNVYNLESLLAVMRTAEEERAPVIIAIGESRMKDSRTRPYLPVLARQMAHEAAVPVGINLDHGKEFQVLMQAVQSGFSSVMIDASMLPYEENVRRTAEIVRISHPLGISVEGEIGHVGMGAEYTDQGAKDALTDPQVAKRFAGETGVDALAVAVGTAHGIYRGTPKLDFDLLEEIYKTVDVPLVLHGGSGTGMENLRHTVELGIRKLNLNTELMCVTRDAVREKLTEEPEIELALALKHGESAMAEQLRTYIRELGSSGQTWSIG